MVDMNPIEQVVVNAMKDIGATKETSIKTADDIMKKCSRPKGMVNNALVSLVQKGIVKRIVREKSSGYFIIGQV
jgi:predicted transcriptional regulator